MIEIDGSAGEGGGQILRSALALSLITGKAFTLRNIRAGRKPKPGLQPQHLASVRAAAAIGSAGVSGASIGSSGLTFEPGPCRPGRYHFPIGTAGATGLVLQTVYLPLLWQASGPSEVVVEGGTHVSNSPCFHFLDSTWRRYVKELGLQVLLEMKRPGFYPRGGGQVIAHIQASSAIKPLRLTTGNPPLKAVGFSAVAGLPEHVARRQQRRAVERLRREGIEAQIDCRAWEGGTGSVLGIVFDEAPIPTSFFALGARGKPAETVADEAADQAIAYARAGAPVDEHSADQIVLPLALAKGSSEFRVGRITRHLTTNVAVIGMFIDRRIDCQGDEGSAGSVRIES